MPTAFTITPPADFVLKRDACSYGYFLLAPNRWVPAELALNRALRLPSGPAWVRITQPGKRGSDLTIQPDRTLSAADRAAVVVALRRMLRLDETADHIRAFHRLDPRWRRSGVGRLCRSPSLFEDVIKTVTSCNVAWPSTVAMNRRLCEHFGQGGCFPEPGDLADLRPATLRARCGVGYRDQRIVDLSRMFADGAVNVAWLEDPATPDHALREHLLQWPGIGPYAANNILQLLGRYGHLPLDSESVRHGRDVLGIRGTERAIFKKVHAHFLPFGDQCFRSYWFELREHHQAKAGPAHTWQTEATATAFTARNLKALAKAARPTRAAATASPKPRAVTGTLTGTPRRSSKRTPQSRRR